LPSPVDWLLKYSMFSTPLICCSSGVATDSLTVSAEAPGKVAVTWIVGGAISGYCVTGSVKYATAPMMVRKVETTTAKIGRSMKKWDRRMGFLLSRVWAGRWCRAAA
jgi:hypothetical protein